jgi:hypothetical protein
MSNTPEIDEVEKYSGVKIKDSVTTCGDESSSVYIPVIFARQLERERDEAQYKLKDAKQSLGFAIEEINALKAAIRETLEENRHLADGDDCTLCKLKTVVEDWK